MVQKFFNITEDNQFVVMRYELTWGLSWEHLLDIMQVFYNDIKDDIHLMEYFFIAGAPGNAIDCIVNDNLRETPICIEEHGGLSFAGCSKIFGFPIKLVIYNQLKILDVYVYLGKEGLKDEFINDHHLIDKYLDSIEIGGYSRDSKRRGMNEAIDMFKKCFIYSEDFSEEEKEKSITTFRETSADLKTDRLYKEDDSKKV